MLNHNTMTAHKSCRSSLVLTLFLLVLGVGFLLSPLQSHALVEMDAKGVNQAVRYGMERGRYGLSEMLGPNWLEASNGTLLNIYSPFMLVATQVAKGRHPANPTPEEFKKAKKTHGRIIRSVTNPRYPQEVKFVLSVLGDHSKFHRTITAKIEGLGHGKKFTLKPSRKIVPRFAEGLPGETNANGEAEHYEAVNAYYFPMKTMGHLDEFDITFYDYNDYSDEDEVTPEKPFEPITFHINNNRIY
jgi:hypothetical protein